MLSHEFRHRVDIQERTDTQDATTGELTTTWASYVLNSNVTLSSVPAKVITAFGREFRESGVDQGETKAIMFVRWFPGLTQKMRIVWDSKTYNIKTYETDFTARRWYRIECTEGVNEG